MQGNGLDSARQRREEDYLTRSPFARESYRRIGESISRISRISRIRPILPIRLMCCTPLKKRLALLRETSVKSRMPDAPQNSDRPHKRLRPSGGYRQLRSYQVATIIYDATVSFCDRFIGTRSRTHDQMVQAARSCGKNIAEGSRAAATTSQTELRLVNVARASLEELLLDYEDFLRQKRLPAWSKDSPEAQQVRRLGKQLAPEILTDPAAHFQAYAKWLDNTDPGIAANALICLIHQTNYLLDQQISALERDFVQEGGYSEQLAAARMAERRKSHSTEPATAKQTTTTAAAPQCGHCGKPMALRTARQGPRAGSQFWGCSGYPECKATLPVG